MADTIITYLADCYQNPKRYVWNIEGEKVLRKIQHACESLTQSQTTD